MTLRRALILLAGPGLYALACLALAGHMPGSGPGALLLGCMGFSAVATCALALGTQARPGREVASGVGLLSLALVLVAPLPPVPHAFLLLLAALALGCAFASWIAPRLTDLSVLLTAAVCLTLFDVWSVLWGPARSAAAGGLLARLLLDAPRPGGFIRFVGVSDLVVMVLLAELAQGQGLGRRRALLAGLAGLLASLVQAYLVARPAPALPWIGLGFVLAHARQVRPDGNGWRRTARWALGTAAALALLTLLRWTTH